MAERTPTQLFEEYQRCRVAEDGEQVTEQVIGLLQRAAEAGHAEAQYQLANIYAQELMEEDSALVLKWYRAAAEQGHAEAQWVLGNYYIEGYRVEKNTDEGLRWFYQAAAQGYTDAYFSLSACYENGVGVEKDPEMAKKWYIKALNIIRKEAENGDAEVQAQLAWYYEPLDFPESLKWYHKAAAQGLASAQCVLGRLYARGEQVERNVKEAEKWLRAAAEQGNKAACEELNRLLAEKKNAQ